MRDSVRKEPPKLRFKTTMLHELPLFSFYFGDTKTSACRDFLLKPATHAELMNNESLAQIAQILKLDQLALLTQTHSALGAVVPRTYSPELPDRPEGDYLITKEPLIGLGVYTADCLPIIFLDPEHQAIGIAHAGWAGSLKQVATTAIKAMQKEFGTSVDQVNIIFGPSALRCCYEVQADFIERLASCEFRNDVLIERQGKLYFDLPLYNYKTLTALGIPASSFDMAPNVCTICNPDFCSNRRNRESTQRQLAVVTLNSPS